ncbi:MAG: hypothetical protein PHV00_11805, partial [Syntrophales bacterium]|nr:hypothetical protein [Syntrophales bacterium]
PAVLDDQEKGIRDQADVFEETVDEIPAVGGAFNRGQRRDTPPVIWFYKALFPWRHRACRGESVRWVFFE